MGYITKEGLSKLKKELDHLMKIERPSISKQIAEARDKGDLSENAEYDSAKEAQGMLEMRISKLQDAIANSKIIDESKIDTSKVQILTKVKIKNTKTNKVFNYTIVPEKESNLKEGKIAIDTPIAKAILGKKPGENVEANVPSGKISFEILEISI
ncbi:MAG: transcription elongation factor GreA [Bacteroidota bacterium]